MPFVTEEIWSYLGEEKALIVSSWPRFHQTLVKESVMTSVDFKYELVKAGRNLRAEYSIPPSKKINYFIKPGTLQQADFIQQELDTIIRTQNAERCSLIQHIDESKPLPSKIVQDTLICIDIEGSLDIQTEINRLSNLIKKIDNDIQKTFFKLNSDAFLSKAPEHIIIDVRSKYEQMRQEKEKYQTMIDLFKRIISKE